MELGFPNLEKQYIVKFTQVKKEGKYEIIRMMKPQELLDLSDREDVEVIRARLIAGEDVVNWKNIN